MLFLLFQILEYIIFFDADRHFTKFSLFHATFLWTNKINNIIKFLHKRKLPVFWPEILQQIHKQRSSSRMMSIKLPLSCSIQDPRRWHIIYSFCWHHASQRYIPMAPWKAILRSPLLTKIWMLQARQYQIWKLQMEQCTACHQTRYK